MSKNNYFETLLIRDFWRQFTSVASLKRIIYISKKVAQNIFCRNYSNQHSVKKRVTNEAALNMNGPLHSKHKFVKTLRELYKNKWFRIRCLNFSKTKHCTVNCNKLSSFTENMYMLQIENGMRTSRIFYWGSRWDIYIRDGRQIRLQLRTKRCVHFHGQRSKEDKYYGAQKR